MADKVICTADGLVLQDLLPGKAERHTRTATSEDLFACPGSSSTIASKAEIEEEKKSAGIPFALFAAARTARAPEVDEDGFTFVRSRKHWVVRGRYPDEVTTLPEDHVCEVEFPWGPMSGGNLRKIKKWSMARKSGSAMTWEGPGNITYGSYGRDGHES